MTSVWRPLQLSRRGVWTASVGIRVCAAVAGRRSMSGSVASSTKRRYSGQGTNHGARGIQTCKGTGRLDLGTWTADGDAEAVACAVQGADANEAPDDAYGRGDVGFEVKQRGRGGYGRRFRATEGHQRGARDVPVFQEIFGARKWSKERVIQ
ncbi:hypothetical protein C8R45DRAFT_1082588 [Mycena sanguinolenta]|nr:hypothetical protein C8R45DRAFT_1082588 [Mycena sanguinolenta]